MLVLMTRNKKISHDGKYYLLLKGHVYDGPEEAFKQVFAKGFGHETKKITLVKMNIKAEKIGQEPKKKTTVKK